MAPVSAAVIGPVVGTAALGTSKAVGYTALGLCQPDGTFVATLQNLPERLAEMTEVGEAVFVDGLATQVQRPGGYANQKVLYDAKRRTHNRLQAGLRAPVEQAIGQLTNVWTLRRWRGLLYRVREVYRAAAALVCLGRWIHRIPT